MTNTVKKGLMAGLSTTWSLGKVIFPITLIVTILQFTPVMPFLTNLISPLMGLFGLSGDAAIALVIGNVLNLYAGIGAILSLELTVKEVFILAMMLSFSHNLFVESVVAMKVGVKMWMILAVRIGLAVTSAIAINLVWNGGGEIAHYGMMPEVAAQPDTWGAIFLLGLEKAAFGVAQLAAIVVPLMVVIQFARDLKWLDAFSRLMAPVTRMLGMKENTSMTLASGLLIGLAFGSAVMIQTVKEDGVSNRDITLAFIFLVACHAVIEDTLIFIPLGIPVWPLLVIRVVTAVLLTIVVARFWRSGEQTEGKEAVQA